MQVTSCTLCPVMRGPKKGDGVGVVVAQGGDDGLEEIAAEHSPVALRRLRAAPLTHKPVTVHCRNKPPFMNGFHDGVPMYRWKYVALCRRLSDKKRVCMRQPSTTV
jgi:hypothetical protein